MLERRKSQGRIISVLLIFALLLGAGLMGIGGAVPFSPEIVYAGDEITVDFTMSVEGDFQMSKNGTDGLVKLPIKVPVGTTVMDLIKKAHELHHADGADGYAEAGGYFSKFWGVTTYNAGYFLNGEMVQTPTTTISQGDDIEATVYKDYSTDTYTRFAEQSLSVPAGAPAKLTLLGNVIATPDWSGGMMMGDTATNPISGATLIVGDSVSANIPWDDSQGAVTNKDGEGILIFETPGTYYVSAKKAGSSFIPAACKVTVTDAESGDAKAEAVAADKNALDFDSIRGANPATSSGAVEMNLSLPISGDSGKTIINWQSNDTSVISNTGAVVRPLSEDGDKAVTLTATITYGSVSETKDILVTVKALPSSEEVLATIISGLPTGRITASEWNSADTAKQDTNIIRVIEALVTDISSSAQVADTCTPSAAQTQIASDGAITYGSTRTDGAVTFEIIVGKAKAEYTATIRVPAKEATKEEALSGDWLTFDSFKADNLSPSAIKTDLSLPGEDDLGYYTEITWTSSDINVVAIDKYKTNNKYPAKVNRPAVGEPDAAVTLTATIKAGLYWDYGMAPAGPMPSPAYTEKTFNITVPAVTAPEALAAQALVEEGIELYTLEDVTIRGTSEKADMQALTYHINNVPYNWNYVDDKAGFKEDFRPINVAWTSENPGIGKVDSGADITRTGEDQTGDIVLTLSYNGGTAVKRFPAKVLAFTAAEAEAENDALAEVKNALTFDKIKKDNTTAEEITTALKRVQGAVISTDGSISFQASLNYHSKGAKIAWSSSNTSVISNALAVTRPAEDTAVTLTATLTSPRFAGYPGVNTETRVFNITVLGRENNPFLVSLAEGYAAKEDSWWGGYPADWWHTVAMAGYAEVTGDTQNVISDTAKQNYVDNQIKALNEAVTNSGTNETTLATTLANTVNGMSALGYDPNSLWTVNRTEIKAGDELNRIDIEAAKEGWYSTVAPYVLIAYNQGGYGSDAQTEAHIEYLKEQLSAEGSWSWSMDTPGMIIQGLVPYYQRTDVKQAVDNAITSLSAIQNDNGSFDDITTNSYASVCPDAMVVIALAQLGINPDTDPRFIKNGNSLYDGLLSYKNAAGDGFDGGDYANKQGFLALVAAAQVMNTGQAYSVYDCNNISKVPAYAVSSQSAVPSTPPAGNKDISVSVTVKTHEKTWLPATKVTVKEDSTVYHAFVTAIDENGFSQTGAARGYISSVTNKSGETLSEFDEGANAGWLFKVNGEVPSIGLTEQKIFDGDKIIIYYTTDWTRDPDAVRAAGGGGAVAAPETVTEQQGNTVTAHVETAATVGIDGAAAAEPTAADITKAIKEVAEAAKAGDGGAVEKEVALKITGDTEASSVEITLAGTSVTALNKGADRLTITTSVGEVSFSAAALKALADNGTGNLKITISKTEAGEVIARLTGVSEEVRADLEGKLKGRPVYNFSAQRGDKEISQFGGKVRMNLSYTPKSGEQSEGLVAYWVREDGGLDKVIRSGMNSDGKTFEIEGNHWSTYAIGYNPVSFSDTESHWAKSSVAYLAARSVIKGKSSDSFAPNAQITRAEFVQILANMSGQDLTGYTGSKFSDVSASAWYAPAVAWAVEKGITAGTGNDKFSPNANITRQDMAVMISKYVKNVEKEALKAVNTAIIFSDENAIADYAKEEVTAMQKAGIINGVKNSSGTYSFLPKNNATRAEAAVMVANYIK